MSGIKPLQRNITPIKPIDASTLAHIDDTYGDGDGNLSKEEMFSIVLDICRANGRPGAPYGTLTKEDACLLSRALRVDVEAYLNRAREVGDRSYADPRDMDYFLNYFFYVNDSLSKTKAGSLNMEDGVITREDVKKTNADWDQYHY